MGTRSGIAIICGLGAERGKTASGTIPFARRQQTIPFARPGPDLLSRSLDGAGGIRSVNGATVLVAAKSEGGGVADLEQGRRLARRVGAQLYVLGNVSAIGNQIRIDASLYDGAPAQPALLSQASASGDTTQLFDLVDRLAGDLMVRRLRGGGSRLLQTAAVTTRSLPALKAYLDAERPLRHGNFDSAFVGFQGAVQLDSTFALAYYRLAVASAWANRTGLIRRNTLRAVALGSRLGERDRRLLASFASLAAGKPDEAEREYRDILQDYPDDFEAQWPLATLLDVYNPFRGRSIEEAGPVFESIVKLDPDFLCLTCAMMHLAVHGGNVQKAESLVVRVGKDYTDSVMFAVAAGDKAAVARLLAEAKSGATPGEVLNAVWQVQQWLYRPADAESFARAMAARPSVVVRGNILLAENLMAQGRWSAADSALLAAGRDPTGGFARVVRGLMAALPFLSVPRVELEHIRADVVAWDPAKDSDLQGPAGALLPQLRDYALGLLASRLGDGETALKQAARLESAEVDSVDRPVVRSLAATVRADVALMAHKPADAVKALEPVRGDVPLDLSSSPWFSEGYARLLRGEAMLAAEDDAGAQRWLENGFAGTPGEPIYAGPAALRLGDIYERQGERQKAIDSYERFVRMWGACEPPLRPLVEQARERLAKLTGEGGM